MWRAMNFFTKGTAKDLFIASKINNDPILLSEAVQMEQAYDRLFTPRGNQFLKKKIAQDEKFSDEDMALIDALIGDFAIRYELELESDLITL